MLFFANFALKIKKSMIRLKNKYTLSILFLLLIAISATAWMGSGIEWNDDLQYMRMPGEGIRFWYSEGPLITSFSDACAAIPYHFTVGSSRLPNLIQVFFNVFPPLLVDLLHGVMIAVFMMMVVISVGGKMALRSLGIVGITTLAVWVLLPWYDHMLASVYLLNYVWVSVVSLLFIRLFKSDDLLSKRWRPLQWVVALIVGLSHEGFALPIIAGATMEIIVNKHDRRRRLILTALVALSATAMFLTPGMLMRLQSQVEPQTWDNKIKSMVDSLYQIIPVYIQLIVTLFTLWRRGVRTVLHFYRENLIYIGIILAGYVIAISSGQVQRGLWFVELVSIILTLKILVENFAWWRRSNVVIGTLAGSLTLFSIGTVVVWQSKFSEEIREVCRQVNASKRSLAYVDLINPGDVPWWTFNIVQSISSSSGNSAYHRHCGFPDNNNILILPTRFKNKPVEQWDKVAGNAGAMGQFPFYVTTYKTGKRLDVTLGEHQRAASPFDIIISKVSTDDVQMSKMKIVRYWKLILPTGEALYCHNINQYDHSMRHRKIVSIDSPKRKK